MKRKREVDENSDEEPPSKKHKKNINLLCPITMETYINPVTLLCGHTFEHRAITKCKECPLCKKAIDIIPELNIELKDVVESTFPDWRANKMYEIEKKESFGKKALERIAINKKKVFQGYLEEMKKDFLERAIKRGHKSGILYKYNTLKLVKREGHFVEFLKFLRENDLNIEIVYKDHWNVSIRHIKWNFIQ